MRAMKPGTGAHIAAAMAALYAPSTPESRAEADALAAEHCARVERGVPRHEVEEAPTDLFSAAAAGQRAVSWHSKQHPQRRPGVPALQAATRSPDFRRVTPPLFPRPLDGPVSPCLK